MATILYRNNNGKLNTYFHGEVKDMFKSSRELVNRATSKGFQITGRSMGDCGVSLTYSKGKVSTTLYICQNDRELENLMFYHK